MGEMIARRLWWIVAGIAALGLALRIAAAQGGLWLDEAWSAVMAAQAATPLGILLHINHDNNHHLNSLWLQLVGPGASPWQQRSLSIASGTATIGIAALIAARRNAPAAIVAALLFALSPILVTYGSEARGYAPMLAMLVTAIWLVDGWLANPDAPPPRLALALAALLGMLANLTMAFGLVALGGWALWRTARRSGIRHGLHRTIRAFLPAAAAAVAILATIILAARASQGGMAIGALEPFTLAAWRHGLFQLFQYGFGHVAIVPLAIVLAGWRTGYRRHERLYSLIVIGALLFPLAVALFAMPNAGQARYYLLTATLVLLGLSLVIGASLTGRRPLPALLALALLIAAMLPLDLTIILDRRADPAGALAAIAARARDGGDVAVDHPRSEAILAAAAASAAYPLTLRRSCSPAASPPARFLFIERDGDAPFPAAPIHCNRRYREIAGDRVQGLSGTQWKLYERTDR